MEKHCRVIRTCIFISENTTKDPNWMDWPIENNPLSQFHISLAAALSLSTNTVFWEFRAADARPSCDIARSQGCCNVIRRYFYMFIFLAIFGVARQPHNNRKIDVGICTKWSWDCSQSILVFVPQRPQGSLANNLQLSCVKRKAAARMLQSVR